VLHYNCCCTLILKKLPDCSTFLYSKGLLVSATAWLEGSKAAARRVWSRRRLQRQLYRWSVLPAAPAARPNTTRRSMAVSAVTCAPVTALIKPARRSPGNINLHRTLAWLITETPRRRVDVKRLQLHGFRESEAWKAAMSTACQSLQALLSCAGHQRETRVVRYVVENHAEAHWLSITQDESAVGAGPSCA
jgi:hypothetical protein